MKSDTGNRKEITAMLSLAVEKHINPKNDSRIYWAKEVTFDYATGHAVRVDYMQFKPANNTVSGIEKGDFYCFEVKSSVEDFHSKNGHNFIGDFNYYVMPEEVFKNVKKRYPGMWVSMCRTIWTGVVGMCLNPSSLQEEKTGTGQYRKCYL